MSRVGAHGAARSTGPFLAPPGRVLSTMNEDGSRRWLEPKPSPGRFLTARRITAYILIALFTLIPYLRMNGKPLILLDIPARRFTLFGTTFFPTDTVLLLFLLLALFLGIFLVTAVLGRVWCGWACPQTVYLEFVFRPLERLIEGDARRRAKRTSASRSLRRALKLAVFVLLSVYLAHTFLAYFVGTEALSHWVTESPAEHPVGFVVMLVTTGLMLLDFGLFREQSCTVVCPYGRFQSVLLDRRSLCVGYDARRGEPRGKHPKRLPLADERRGDCVDCGACVVTCPTGIDIRDGLQMECVHCTQCIDACDAVMDKLKRPRGLVRYGSQDELAGAPRTGVRWRLVLYPLLLTAALGAFVVLLVLRQPAKVTVLRGLGTPFALTQDGSVTNQIRIKVANRGAADASYHIELEGLPEAELIAPENPLFVAAEHSAETSVFVVAPAALFKMGSREVVFRVRDERGFDARERYRLLGPAAGGRR
ncbi:MAG: cytochrome c oxidase accessory protein CcoG [Myxococcales bacterium]|nr:cytochrome c oxidase accessory protein CcoG [Myxococcales bacterium]